MLNNDTYEIIGLQLENKDDLYNYNKIFDFHSLARKLHYKKQKEVLKQINIFFEYKYWIIDFKEMLIRYNFDYNTLDNVNKIILKLANETHE
jgi:hypothetical protein